MVAPQSHPEYQQALTVECTLLFLLSLDCGAGLEDTNQDTLEQAISCWKFPMVVVKELALNFLCSLTLLLTKKSHVVGLLCSSSEGVSMQPVSLLPGTGATLEESVPGSLYFTQSITLLSSFQ